MKIDDDYKFTGGGEDMDFAKCLRVKFEEKKDISANDFSDKTQFPNGEQSA